MEQVDNAEGSSSMAGKVIADTEGLLQKGIAHYKAGEMDECVEALESVLSARSEHCNSFAIECAAANYYYGVALYQQLKENQDVFEDSDIDKKLEASQGESGSKAEDGPKEGNAEEVNDDLSIAWEALEVAKQSYIKDGMEKHKGALADVHCALGDVSVEAGVFDTAVGDYARTVSLLHESDAPDNRKICEVHFRCSLAEEFAEHYEEARVQCSLALERLQKELRLCAEEEGGEHGHSEKEKELLEIVQDLKERIKELEESIANKDTIQKMLKGLFHNGLKASKQPNLTKGSEEPVKDLGVLGRRKQTAENAPRDAGKMQGKDDTPDVSQAKPKRARIEPEKM